MDSHVMLLPQTLHGSKQFRDLDTVRKKQEECVGRKMYDTYVEAQPWRLRTTPLGKNGLLEKKRVIRRREFGRFVLLIRAW